MGGLIGTIIVGALAGWLGTQFMGRRGFGLFANIIIGIAGGAIGGLLFGLIGFKASNVIGRLISGTIGAMVLLAVVGSHKQHR